MSNTFTSLFKRSSFEKTKNIYSLPLNPETKIKNILYDWPSHEGPFRGAVDFAVDLGSAVLAPLDGKVIEIVDQFDRHGETEEFAPFLNYITIAHENGEYSQLAHIKKSSVKVKIGDFVKTGQKLAVTGLNGWMMEPYLEHLHMLVFKLQLGSSFKGLEIRFLKELKEDPKSS
ncbi:M23 family metallopeptidase [Candidatus Daviesbacteria bacterium]|nr:M23 family metallopeptidase [Candidatus Daviesbacteria bacterium]